MKNLPGSRWRGVQRVMKTSDLNRAGQLVRLIKRASTPVAQAAPGSWNDWVPGARNNHGSLPIDYEMTGFLLKPIRVGEAVQLWRLSRNGITAQGIFVSTTVRELRGGESVITNNSIYEVKLAQKE